MEWLNLATYFIAVDGLRAPLPVPEGSGTTLTSQHDVYRALNRSKRIAQKRTNIPTPEVIFKVKLTESKKGPIIRSTALAPRIKCWFRRQQVLHYRPLLLLQIPLSGAICVSPRPGP